ncbi:MAG: cation-translocating P-type ATPase [Anaerolineae bacterium]|nr:cation-translocating P-type ATPase [Anaerolineae bacterium]
MESVSVEARPAEADAVEQAHTHTVDAVLAALGSDANHGLGAQEAERRLEQYGPNELREAPRPGFWQLLLRQFKNFLVIILVVACLISLALGEYLDATAILAIVILNAALGVVQESRAEEALAALKKMAAPEATVIRDGRPTTIPAVQLVPGDVVLLEAGDFIPADVRLIEAVNLRVDEAALTGESHAVEKDARALAEADSALGDRRNMAYLGTTATYGRGRAVVVRTGMNTEIGRIAEMIQSYEEEATPLQRRLDQLGKWLGVGALAVSALVFLLGSLGGQDVLEMFLVAVSLAIAAVPEGLPAVVTISLALGLQRMVRRHALIRNLPAVETLGSATAICSDKTGTLTQNEMMVVRLYVDGQEVEVTGKGYEPVGRFISGSDPIDPKEDERLTLLLTGAALCNDSQLERDEGDSSWAIYGDPTEAALVVAAAKAGLWKEALSEEHRRLAEAPFDSARKRMATVHPDGREGRYVIYVKGAPDILLDLSTRVLTAEGPAELTPEGKERILEHNHKMAAQALRVLGLAYREVDKLPDNPTPDELERDLVFVGLLGMIDPPRPEVREAIRVAKRAGLSTYMVTGDYLDTAVAIAKDLDLIEEGDPVLSGAEISRIPDEEFVRVAPQVRVYARVSPEHKVRLVEALRQNGHVVAMTGDGVNDAPAVKRANIGVAMGITGTDVTKQTADMVLTDDNYASIVAAIEEGRVIYSNIRKFVYYLLSCNVGEILIVFLATLLGWPVPLTAIQLLVLNLLTDGAPALALGLEKGDPDIMDRPPRRVDEPILNQEMRVGIGVQAIAIGAATLTAYRLGMHWFPDDIGMARAMGFATLTLSELFRAYTARSEYYSVFRIGFFSNKYMQYAVLVSLGILALMFYVPPLHEVFDTRALTLGHWLDILPLALIPSVAAEATKALLLRQLRNRRVGMER